MLVSIVIVSAYIVISGFTHLSVGVCTFGICYQTLPDTHLHVLQSFEEDSATVHSLSKFASTNPQSAHLCGAQFWPRHSTVR